MNAHKKQQSAFARVSIVFNATDTLKWWARAHPTARKFMYDYVRHIETYNHNNRIAVMVEFGLQDDFATKTDEFRRFAHTIAIHIAAMAPDSVDALLAQNDVHAPERTVADALLDIVATLQTPVAIRRFVRWTADISHTKPEQPDPPRAPANILRFGTTDR